MQKCQDGSTTWDLTAVSGGTYVADELQKITPYIERNALMQYARRIQQPGFAWRGLPSEKKSGSLA
jgi:hypothetical protein